MKQSHLKARLQEGKPCLIIGEVGQGHDGSLGLAHAFIDALATTGVDAVKFQTHIANAESTRAEPWRVKFSPQDQTRYDYWRRMEFTEPQWKALHQHAEERGLIFLSSAFSVEAVELLTRIGVGAWKVASGELNNHVMLERMIGTGLPIMLSTGMNPMAEVDAAVSRIRARGIGLAVLQCTSEYPCPPEKVGLNVIESFRDRYQCPVGLSDHSGTIYPGLAAATMGISVLEVHVTLSREMFGPDIPASLTTAEIRQLVEGVRFIEKMVNNPVGKDAMAHSMADLRLTFTKSVVARRDLCAGAILQADDLAVKKPGSGIPAGRLHEVVGRRLCRNVRANSLLREEDFT